MKDKDKEAGLSERIACLETRMDELIQNHLPHLRDDINEIRWWVRGIAVAIALSILTFMLDHFLGN